MEEQSIRASMGAFMMTERTKAREPEDLARLFVERVNAVDAAGLAELYEPEAVLGFPPGKVTVGRDAIRAVCEASGGRAALRGGGSAAHAAVR